MKRALLVVAFAGYAWAQSELLSLAYSHNHELKALESELSALEKEVDLSKIWENPTLNLGVNDIFLREPLIRNQEAQNEAISLSQKIPLGGKLDIKESIALQDVAIKKLELQTKKLEMQQEIATLEQTYVRITQDLALVAKYEKILEDLKNAHLAYNTTSAHYVDTLNNTILQKNLSIEKKTLLKEKASLERKLESILATSMPEWHAKEGLLSYGLSDEEKRLEKAPKLQLQNLQSTKELLNLRYEKATKIPDVTISLGYNRRQGRDDYAFLGFEIPLPIYGKENLSIQKAKLTHSASEQSVLNTQKQLLFELKDELLNKELQYDKIALSKEVLHENQKMYEVLQSTALSQNDALLSLLNVLTQMLEAQKQINANTFAYNESIIKIYTLLGEPL
ncbi:TolC family protein [Sulfurospirillum sp. UCH001]|uniref:TolC family protein n=1 Tax=Sulfurospirillum sp. UCH001 TaxID=1581011 RepID=UPI00082F079A|nr:TolC family protein [Sulfurospirillum sp. UCH001]